jgi:hypothetical protein
MDYLHKIPAVVWSFIPHRRLAFWLTPEPVRPREFFDWALSEPRVLVRSTRFAERAVFVVDCVVVQPLDLAALFAAAASSSPRARGSTSARSCPSRRRPPACASTSAGTRPTQSGGRCAGMVASRRCLRTSGGCSAGALTLANFPVRFRGTFGFAALVDSGEGAYCAEVFARCARAQAGALEEALADRPR